MACKQCLIRAYCSPDSDEAIFLQKKAILWIEDSYLSMKHWFEGTNILMMDLFFYKHAAFGFTRHELVDWSGVDYLWIVMTVFYQLFGRKDHLYRHEKC